MSELSYPLANKGTVTSQYGPRWGRMHRGVDIGVPDGTDVHAVADGVVARSDIKDYNGYGNFICIEHDNIGGKKKFSCYAHLTKRLVDVGDEVSQGSLIGKSGGGQGKKGGSGSSTGPHLHFEIRNSLTGDWENPWPYISGGAIIKGGEPTKKNKKKKSSGGKLFGGKELRMIAFPKDHAKRSTSDWQSSHAWDIGQEPGTPVYSLTSGKVARKHESSGAKKNIFGTQLSIKGIDGYPDMFYTHLEDVNLSIGDEIHPGQLVGKITRWDFAPKSSHVHIGISNNKDIFEFMDSKGNIKNSTVDDSDVADEDEDTDSEKTFSLKSIFSKLAPQVKKSLEYATSEYEKRNRGLNEEVDRIKDIFKKIL